MIADRIIVTYEYFANISIKEGKENYVKYYFWNSRKKLLEQGFKSCNSEKSEKLHVKYSSKEERQKIISSMITKGVHAFITDVKTMRKEFFCLAAEYGNPKGYVRIAGYGRDDDTFLLLEEKGQKHLKEIDFNNLAYVEFEDYKDNDVKVVMKNGKILRGKWLRPLLDGMEQRIYLYGIDKNGNLMSKNLEDVIKIEFVY